MGFIFLIMFLILAAIPIALSWSYLTLFRRSGFSNMAISVAALPILVLIYQVVTGMETYKAYTSVLGLKGGSFEALFVFDEGTLQHIAWILPKLMGPFLTYVFLVGPIVLLAILSRRNLVGQSKGL